MPMTTFEEEPGVRAERRISAAERRAAALEAALSCCLGALKVLVLLVKDEPRRQRLEKSIQEAERALF